MHGRVLPTFWLALWLLTLARPTQAATRCPAMPGADPRLAEIDAAHRLAWIDARLAVDAKRALIWSVTWQTAFTAITLTQAGLLLTTTNQSDRAVGVVATAAASIGVIARSALPLSVVHDQALLRAALTHATPADDSCALLAWAEQLLARDADSEAFGKSPIVHVGNFLVNTAAGLILGLGYDRWAPFAYMSIVGIAVGELQAITQPVDAVEDLHQYLSGHLAAPSPKPQFQLGFAPMLTLGGGGALLTGTF